MRQEDGIASRRGLLGGLPRCRCSSRRGRAARPEPHPSVTHVTQANACAPAILAGVQVSSKARSNSSGLARDLLAVMLYIQKHSGNDFYVLVEELDLTLTQLKALHALDLAAEEASVKELG